MKNLLDLLERLNRSLNKDALIKKAVVAEAGNLGVRLKEEEIFLKEGVLEVSASPAVKNELRLKEEALRRVLRENHRLNILRVLYR